MKQLRIVACFTVALLAGLTALALGCSEPRAVEPGTVLVAATSMDYPPFGYLDEEGGPAGFDYQYGRLLCQWLEADCQWHPVPFEEAVAGTARGDFDLAVTSLTQTERQEQSVSFSDPYYHAYGQFIRLAGSGATPENAGVIATHKNSLYERYLSAPVFEQAEVLALDTLEEILDAVSQRQADLAMVDDVIADLAANQSPFLPGDALGAFERAGGPVVPAPGSLELQYLGSGRIGIIVPKGNEYLLPDINRAIREINQGREIAEISQSYFGRNIVSRE